MNNTYGSNALNVAGQSEVRQPQVDSATSDLMYQIAELEQTLGVMVGRLSGVLSQSPQSAIADAPALGYSCDLAQSIGCAADRVRSQRVGLIEILARLEI